MNPAERTSDFPTIHFPSQCKQSDLPSTSFSSGSSRYKFHDLQVGKWLYIWTNANWPRTFYIVTAEVSNSLSIKLWHTTVHSDDLLRIQVLIVYITELVNTIFIIKCSYNTHSSCILVRIVLWTTKQVSYESALSMSGSRSTTNGWHIIYSQ